MVRSNFAGDTDYTLQPFANLVYDLGSILDETVSRCEIIRKNRNKLKKLFKGEVLSSDFKSVMSRGFQLFQLIREFKSYLPSIENKNIKEYHVIKLQDAGVQALRLSNNLGAAFHNYDMRYERWKLFSESEKQFIMYQVYAPLRSCLLGIYDLENIAFELRKYIGKTDSNRAVEGEKTKSYMVWDAESNILRCGKTTHHFHQGRTSEKILLNLFRVFWRNRRHMISGRCKASGVAVLREEIASEVGLGGTEEKREFMERLKSLKRVLREKKFPCKIIKIKLGGLLLVVNDK